MRATTSVQALLSILTFVYNNNHHHPRVVKGDEFDETDNDRDRDNDRDSLPSYYERYPSYPPYCSHPDDMALRSIPPLPWSSSSLSLSEEDAQLVHVTAVIRHGQRTPYAGDLPCWPGYHEPDRDTGRWDCPAGAETIVWMEQPGDLRFEKRYDALRAPLGNALGPGSTCQLGQLLDPPGYDQETRNGRILREAYVGDRSTGDTYRSYLLLRNDTDRPLDPGSTAVFRSDDEERTLRSGQLLWRELFRGMDPSSSTVPLHTADFDRDVLHPNERICPALTNLRREAINSEAFQRFNSSLEANELRRILRDELGGPPHGFYRPNGGWTEHIDIMMDCLMTTICTDRELPDAVNDYGDTDDYEHDDDETTDHYKGVFERLVDFVTLKETFHLRYNDGLYSKVAMGPLWSEIMDKILPLGDVENQGPEDFFDTMRDRGIPRFALYSGHDSTIMPLLASLGADVYDGEVWTPYAGMVVIEIHAINVEDPLGPLAFRLLYDGEVITDRLDGCDSDSQLCNLNVLFDHVLPFASVDRPECAVEVKREASWGLFQDDLEPFVLFLISLGSAIVGCLFAQAGFVDRLRWWRQRGSRRPVISPEIEYGPVTWPRI